MSALYIVVETCSALRKQNNKKTTIHNGFAKACFKPVNGELSGVAIRSSTLLRQPYRTSSMDGVELTYGFDRCEQRTKHVQAAQVEAFLSHQTPSSRSQPSTPRHLWAGPGNIDEQSVRRLAHRLFVLDGFNRRDVTAHLT